MTIEQVQKFAEESWTNPATIVFFEQTWFLFAVAMVLIGMAIFSAKKKYTKMRVFLNAIAVTFILAAFVFGIPVAKKQGDINDEKYLKNFYVWEEKYLEPYMRNLPEQTKTDIKKIEYNEDIKTEEGRKENNGRTPVKITFQNGEEIDIWVKIKPLGIGEEKRVKFKLLEENLFFSNGGYSRKSTPEIKQWGYAKGYHSGVLYTDKIE